MPSSRLSHPSGLLWDTIANLTFDKLLLNSTFARYVSLVDILVDKSPQQRKFELIIYLVLADTLTASPVAPVASPSGSSLRPCNSASQLSSPGGKMPPPLPPDRPSNCPDHYLQAILW